MSLRTGCGRVPKAGLSILLPDGITAASFLDVWNQPMRTNWARNPGAEYDAPLLSQQWGGAGNNQNSWTWSYDTTVFHSGTRAVRKTLAAVNATQDNSAMMWLTNDLVLGVGEQATFSFWIYLSIASAAGNGQIYTEGVRGDTQAYAANGGGLFLPAIPALTWTKISFTITNTQQWQYAVKKAGFYNLTGMIAGDYMVVDEMLAEKGATVGTYFDDLSSGMFAPDYEVVCQGSKATGLIQVEPVAVQATGRRNYIVNSSFETNVTGWGQGGQNNSSFAVETSYFRTGSNGKQSMKVTATAAAPFAAVISSVIPASDVIPGQIYTASCWVLVLAGNPQVRIQLFGGGVVSGAPQYNSAFSNPSAHWQRLTATITAVSAVAIGFSVIGTATAAGQIFYLDEVLFEFGDLLNDYYEGFTPTQAGYEYSWVDVPNNSVSVAIPPQPTRSLVDLGQVATSNSNSTTNVSSFTATVTKAVPVGALLVGSIGFNYGALPTGSTMTDSKGNVYTLVMGQRSATYGNGQFWATIATALAVGDVLTFTMGGGGNANRRTIVASAFTGAQLAPGSTLTGSSTSQGVNSQTKTCVSTAIGVSPVIIFIMASANSALLYGGTKGTKVSSQVGVNNWSAAVGYVIPDPTDSAPVVGIYHTTAAGAYPSANGQALAFQAVLV